MNIGISFQPYIAAARGYVDDVIEPASTRIRLISALEMLAGKRENRPAKTWKYTL